MGTISEKLNYLMDTKVAIKNALIEKGAEVSDNDTFRSYSNKILEIPSGGEWFEPSLYSTIVVPNIEDITGDNRTRLAQSIEKLVNLSTTNIGETNQYIVKLLFQDNLSNIDCSLQTDNCHIQYIMDMSRCSQITELSVDKTVFNSPHGLIEVILPNGIKTIKNSVLNYVTDLKQIYIPNSIETIENNAFYYLPQNCTVIIDKEPDSISGAPWGAYYADTLQIIWKRT